SSRTGSLPSGRVDLTGDEDPTDEDGDIGMGDSTGVSVSLGGGISLRGKKSRESNNGDSDNTGDGGTIVGGGINKLFKDSEEVLPVPLGNIGEAGYIVWKVRGKSILNIESRVVGRRHHSVNNPMSFVGNSRFDETKETSNETKGLKRKARILQKMEDLKILEDLLKKIKMTVRRVTTAKVNGLSGYSVYVLFEVLNGKTHGEVSLGGGISSGGKKSRESNIGDSGNTGDGGKTGGGSIGACGGIGGSLVAALYAYIYGSS
ncbi:hypothetical protein Tco_0888106, partial [Tanacetum coccineum]